MHADQFLGHDTQNKPIGWFTLTACNNVFEDRLERGLHSGKTLDGPHSTDEKELLFIVLHHWLISRNCVQLHWLKPT